MPRTGWVRTRHDTGLIHACLAQEFVDDRLQDVVARDEQPMAITVERRILDALRLAPGLGGSLMPAARICARQGSCRSSEYGHSIGASDLLAARPNMANSLLN